MNHAPISPLALIAVFAGVIEASALASLPFLSEDSQTLYTWFLVGFPFFLTVLFFLTLNFNTGSLFAPGSPPSAPVQNTIPGAAPSKSPRPFTAEKGAIIVAISGPKSRKMIENQIQRIIGRPCTVQRRWVLYNLDTRVCFHVTAQPMDDNSGGPFDVEPTL